MNKIKTFIKKNSKKIAIGVGLVALAGTAGYFGYNRIRLTEQVKSNDSIINNLIDSNSALKHSNATLQEAVKAYKEDHEEVTFLKFLVIESDCVPKALQNAENKLARKETKIKSLIESLSKCPNNKELVTAKQRHEHEASILRYQIAKTYNLNDLIHNDENIYAK